MTVELTPEQIVAARARYAERRPHLKMPIPFELWLEKYKNGLSGGAMGYRKGVQNMKARLKAKA